VLNAAQDRFDELDRFGNVELRAWKFALVARFIKRLSTEVNGANHSAILLCESDVVRPDYLHCYW
jgi:hypothetical protein